MRLKHEARVWREPGFEDGDRLAWRAQVWENRKKPVSGVGVGLTSEAALKDCIERWLQAQEQAARDWETVTWVPLAPLAKPGVP